jgi:hypothetical protein
MPASLREFEIRGRDGALVRKAVSKSTLSVHCHVAREA